MGGMTGGGSVKIKAKNTKTQERIMMNERAREYHLPGIPLLPASEIQGTPTYTRKLKKGEMS